jgi:DNA-binding LacI/PurR family transcriptional regulator
MAITSADVARRAGVSRSTVSYVLNGQADRFSPATQEAVRRAVADLEYMPQAAGRSLRRGESDLVVAGLPVSPNASITSLMAALTDALADRGLSLLLRTAGSSLAAFTAALRSLHPRAFLALADLTDAERDVLDGAGVRVLEVARAGSERGGPQWRAGQLQVTHLLERGYRRIVYARLAEAREDIMMGAREDGARAACRDAGLPEMEVVTVALRADADLEVISAVPSGTGIACYNDDAAAAALGAAHALGREVPADLGIVGMDDTPVATQVSPRLTTVGYETTDVVARLVEILTTEGTTLRAEDVPFDLAVVPGGTT